MTVYELNRDQLEELKQAYLTEMFLKNDDEPSYGDLAEADDRISDDDIYEAYSHVDFVPDDFFCSAGEDMRGCDGVGMLTHLIPTDSHKSFYGKAVLEHDDDRIVLYSYNTPVAQYDKSAGILYILPNREYAPKGKYSMTTTRHIRAFANQLGINIGAAKVGAY